VNNRGNQYGAQLDHGPLKVMEVNDSEPWDNLIRDSSAGTIFHTSLWQDCSPHSFVRLSVYGSGRLLAGAAIQIHDILRPSVGSLAPYIGPVSASRNRGEENRRAVSLLAASLKEIPGVKFYTSPWFETRQPFILAGFGVRLFYTSVVQLESVGAAWSKFTSGLRRNIRRAEFDGCSVERTTDPTTLLSLVRKTFSRQERSIWFDLDEAHDCMDTLGRKGLASCFVTYNSAAEPVAAAGIVWDWQRSYYILGGYDDARGHSGGSSLALWHAIMYTCKELQLTEFDLDGSHIPAIERFFRQFGGRLIPSYCVTGTLAPLLESGDASTNAN
jgi:hypothetical protein